MDSINLGALVSARKQALQAGYNLLLTAPRRLVLRLLSLIDPAGLPVFASVEQAANGAGGPRRPTAWFLDGCTVKLRRGMVRLTRWEPKPRRPSRGRLPPAMCTQKGGHHNQFNRRGAVPGR